MLGAVRAQEAGAAISTANFCEWAIQLVFLVILRTNTNAAGSHTLDPHNRTYVD